MSDVLISDQGNIVGLTVQTPEARAWFDENVQTEPWQWLGDTLGVEHRYADQLLQGLQEAGFSLGRN